jgi:hypothetical protein
MRFCSINIYSGEDKDGDRKRKLTGMLRQDSDHVVDLYLKCFKYYNNDICISLNISCDENTDTPFVEPNMLQKGYPVLHIPIDLEKYFETTDKSSYWEKTIFDAINYVCDLWNWDKTFFEDAYSRFAQRRKEQLRCE